MPTGSPVSAFQRFAFSAFSLLLVLAVPPLPSAEIDDFLKGVEPPRAYDAAAFRAFFAGTKPLTAFQVRDRFGLPHKYGPLDRSEKDKKISPFRAWWFYELGPIEAVEVRMEDGKVTEVIRQHGRDTEVIRRAPPPPPEKARR